MTSNFRKASLLFSALILAFMVPQAIAMDPQITQTSTPTKKYSSVNNEMNTASLTDYDPMSKHYRMDQDIFNKLNTSLSFLLTTQEVLSTLLEDSANCDSSFVFHATIDKSKPFWHELTSIDPTVLSINALRLVCQLICKHNQLYELTAMNMEVLHSIHNNPCDNPYYASLELSPLLMEFARENANVVKGFVHILMNAHKDPEISQVINNPEMFSSILSDPYLLTIIGNKDLIPFHMANSQSARIAQKLQIYTQIQEEIDNILIFKNLIFPDGKVTSYHHNKAAQVRTYCEDSLNALQVGADRLHKMLSYIEGEDFADPRHNTIKFWKDFRCVLLENYQVVLKALPEFMVQLRGISTKAINKVYEAKTEKINLHRLKNNKFCETSQNIAFQLIINTINPTGDLSSSEKVSIHFCCCNLVKQLEGKKYSIEDLFTTLEQTLPDLLIERKELGLLPESFFLESLFQELKKSLDLPVNERDPHNLLPTIKVCEEEAILPSFTPKRTPQKSLKKKKKRAQKQLANPDAHQEIHAPQEDLIQTAEPLKAIPLLEVDQGDKEIQVATTSIPQIAVEKAPTVTIPSINIEKEVEFGADYFRVLHAHYQTLKNSQKNQLGDGTNLLLTPYEFKLFVYLKDNVFNNNNRPSWNGIVQDLGGLGFLGKPNTVGNGSTWVFSVTPKNGLFFADENYRYATFNVHCIHGKKGNEPLPIPYLKFFQSGFSHMFGLTKEVVEECLRHHNSAENLLTEPR